MSFINNYYTELPRELQTMITLERIELEQKERKKEMHKELLKLIDTCDAPAEIRVLAGTSGSIAVHFYFYSGELSVSRYAPYWKRGIEHQSSVKRSRWLRLIYPSPFCVSSYYCRWVYTISVSTTHLRRCGNSEM